MTSPPFQPWNQPGSAQPTPNPGYTPDPFTQPGSAPGASGLWSNAGQAPSPGGPTQPGQFGPPQSQYGQPVAPQAPQPNPGGAPPGYYLASDGQYYPLADQPGPASQPGAPGQFGSNQFGSGQFGSGQFGSGQFGSGQFGSGQFGVPSQPDFPDQSGPQAPAPKKKRGVLVAVAVVVALAVAGGGAYALLALKGGSAGASSPEDAAKALFNDTETLLTDMAALDIAKVASHFAPSEQGLFEGVADASKSVTTDNAQSDALKESLEAAQKALAIDFKDLEFTGETIAEGVNRTAVTGGTISLDADVPALATAILDIYDSRPSISQMGLDPIDQSHLEEQLGAVFPVSKGADDLAALAGLNDLFVVTVQEEGDWFVSLSMTAAQYSFEDSGLDRVDLGDPIPESEMKGASDANGALDNFISALDAAATSGDLRELAKALPVAESRLVAVYGPALTSADEGGAAGLSEVLGGVTGTKTGEIGGHARITLDSLVIPGYFTLTRQDDTWTLSIEDGGEQIEVTLTQESRQKWTFDLAQNSEYGVTTGSASISIPSKGVIEGEVVSEGMAVSFKYEGGCVSVDMMGEAQEMCGDELGVDLADSGLDELEKLPDLKSVLALSAIKGAGGDWYISIGASLLDWAAALVE